MSDETKLKIIILGPSSSGKTSVSNFLSDATENISGENRPTKGVRILEFLAEGLKIKDKAQYKAEIELWDCSGDLKYDSCWPAILYKTDGIVFVYARDSAQDKKDLETFYDFFVERSGFSEKNCVLFLNQTGAESNNGKAKTNPLPKINYYSVNIEEKGADLRKAFNSFLSDLINRKSKNSPD